MLRGRCSCAISARPTSSPAPKLLLSPLFPLLPGKSPVSPLFPLLTQKQGGGGVGIPRDPMTFTTAPVTLSSPGDSNRLENSAPNCRLSAVNCKPAFLRPAFTTTSIDIVGAPTFPFLHSYVAATFRWPPEGGRYTSKRSARAPRLGRRPVALAGALYAEAARYRLVAGSEGRTEIGALLIRRTQCCHVRYF
jgi:hypothetical protein